MIFISCQLFSNRESVLKVNQSWQEWKHKTLYCLWYCTVLCFVTPCQPKINTNNSSELCSSYLNRVHLYIVFIKHNRVRMAIDRSLYVTNLILYLTWTHSSHWRSCEAILGETISTSGMSCPYELVSRSFMSTLWYLNKNVLSPKCGLKVVHNYNRRSF